MVPTFVERLSVSANIAAQTGGRLHVLVEAQRQGVREAGGNVFALDSVTSRPVVLMDGLRFVTISASKSDKVQTKPKHCFRPVWEPDVQLLDRRKLDRELQAASPLDDRPKTVRELE